MNEARWAGKTMATKEDEGISAKVVLAGRDLASVFESGGIIG